MVGWLTILQQTIRHFQNQDESCWFAPAFLPWRDLPVEWEKLWTLKTLGFPMTNDMHDSWAPRGVRNPHVHVFIDMAMGQNPAYYFYYSKGRHFTINSWTSSMKFSFNS